MIVDKDFNSHYKNDVTVGTGGDGFASGMKSDGIHVTTTYEVTPSREFDV